MAHAPAPYQQLNAAVECGDPPKSIAVLPFVNHTDTEGLENEFRLGVFGHIAVQAYRDVELSLVDSRLRDKGLLKNRAFTHVSIRKLGRILQCDAVVMGEVLNFDRIFLGIYSQMSIEGSITVWDTRSGTKIWTDEQSVRMHEGGVPLSLLDVPLISVRSGYNLMENNREDIVEDLSEQLVARMPAPACFLTVDAARVRYAYELQAGAYLVREHAVKLKKYLEERGYSARIRSNWD
jgi:hypothetical protein